ncbi:hypothetical protein ACYPKM_04385 [Pseudomonas aeruginosa]
MKRILASFVGVAISTAVVAVEADQPIRYGFMLVDADSLMPAQVCPPNSVRIVVANKGPECIDFSRNKAVDGVGIREYVEQACPGAEILSVNLTQDRGTAKFAVALNMPVTGCQKG